MALSIIYIQSIALMLPTAAFSTCIKNMQVGKKQQNQLLTQKMTLTSLHCSSLHPDSDCAKLTNTWAEPARATPTVAQCDSTAAAWSQCSLWPGQWHRTHSAAVFEEFKVHPLWHVDLCSCVSLWLCRSHRLQQLTHLCLWTRPLSLCLSL